MKWFRYWSEAISDPKVQLLPGDDFKGWINLLSIVNETEPSRGKNSGYLPSRIEDVAYKLHGRAPDASEQTQALLDRLVLAGLFDEVRGRYRAHNWPKRQPVSDDVGARVAKSRKGVTGNVAETLHAPKKRRTRTAPEEEEETEQRRADPDHISEQEPEAEADEDFARAFGNRLRVFGLRDGSEMVRASLEASGLECVLHCMDEAERHNARSWAYVDEIRRRHEAEGCPDPELITLTERMTGRSRY